MDSLAIKLVEHAASAPIQGGFRGAGSLAGRLLDFISSHVGSLSHLDTEAKLAVKVTVLKVYDTFNLPQLPDVIETPLKAIFRPVLESGLDSLLGLNAG